MTARIARVIDYETTGTPDDADAEIIEFGRIDVDLTTREIGNPWSSLCLPRGPIPAVTKAVHHITEDDAPGLPRMDRVQVRHGRRHEILRPLLAEKTRIKCCDLC